MCYECFSDPTSSGAADCEVEVYLLNQGDNNVTIGTVQIFGYGLQNFTQTLEIGGKRYVMIKGFRFGDSHVTSIHLHRNN